jgi:hypothetical protein
MRIKLAPLVLERIFKYPQNPRLVWVANRDSYRFLRVDVFLCFYETNGMMPAKKISRLFTLKGYSLKHWNVAYEVMGYNTGSTIFLIFGLCGLVLLLERFDRSEDGPGYNPVTGSNFKLSCL